MQYLFIQLTNEFFTHISQYFSLFQIRFHIYSFFLTFFSLNFWTKTVIHYLNHVDSDIKYIVNTSFCSENQPCPKTHYMGLIHTPKCIGVWCHNAVWCCTDFLLPLLPSFSSNSAVSAHYTTWCAGYQTTEMFLFHLMLFLLSVSWDYFRESSHPLFNRLPHDLKTSHRGRRSASAVLLCVWEHRWPKYVCFIEKGPFCLCFHLSMHVIVGGGLQLPTIS